MLESGAWQQRIELPITVATRAPSPRFQSSANEIENLSKVCQTFCLLEQKVQQACQTCQTCRFRNWGVKQTQIPSLPILPFSELVPIKHTLKYACLSSRSCLGAHQHAINGSAWPKSLELRCDSKAVTMGNSDTIVVLSKLTKKQ